MIFNGRKIFIFLFSPCLLFLFGCATGSNINRDLARIPQDAHRFVQKRSGLNHYSSEVFRKKLLKNYLHYYFSPWDQPDLFFSFSDIKEIEEKQLQKYKKNPGWGSNRRPLTQEWVEECARNMNLGTFPNIKRKAITVRRTNLRLFPTEDASFTSLSQIGQGFPFDKIQEALVRKNLPVYVLQVSRDGGWSFILTSDQTYGWVKSLDLAYVDSRFIKMWKQGSFIVTFQDKTPIFDNKMQHDALSRIGEIFPFYQETDSYYKILLAFRDVNGQAVVKRTNISKRRAERLPIRLTEENIACVINNLMNEPYGWGDLSEHRDCSSVLKDLFAPFAIWLPRNSGDQSKVGHFVSMKGMMNYEKEQLIIKKGTPFLTILWLPGHVVLYLGEKDDKPYVFQNVWALRTRNILTAEETRARIGRAVITPLDFGHRYMNVSKTFLDWMQGMVFFMYNDSE